MLLSKVAYSTLSQAQCPWSNPRLRVLLNVTIVIFWLVFKTYGTLFTYSQKYSTKNITGYVSNACCRLARFDIHFCTTWISVYSSNKPPPPTINTAILQFKSVCNVPFRHFYKISYKKQNKTETSNQAESADCFFKVSFKNTTISVSSFSLPSHATLQICYFSHDSPVFPLFHPWNSYNAIAQRPPGTCLRMDRRWRPEYIREQLRQSMDHLVS